jgi:hypothetical protein
MCEVVSVTEDTIREAIRLVARYQLSHWDSLIVAAALLANCETLYSEDMQHGQVFEERGGLRAASINVEGPSPVAANLIQQTLKQLPRRRPRSREPIS